MNSKIRIALALLAAFHFSNVQAAPSIDNEIAILASESPKSASTAKVEEKATPVEKTKKELEAEQKRLREEKRAEEKRLKAERDAARKQIEEGRKEQINTDRRANLRRTSASETISTATSKASVESSEVVQTAAIQAAPTVGMPNPMVSYASYEELAKAVGFTPLYVPKKSGYTVTEIFSIDNKIAEIRYGRRWEPEVSLHIRTYKRAPGEELQDISGISGVKWRVDTTGGTTVYVAKVNDSTNAAAWAVGDYTFSAYVENLSFAAFHALVVEELVDLTLHYYVS